MHCDGKQQTRNKSLDKLFIAVAVRNRCSAFGLGVIKVLEVPRGARHLLIQELNGTSHILGEALLFPVVFNEAAAVFT